MILVRAVRRYFVVLLLIGASACRIIVGPGGSDARRLRDAREQWASQGIVDYEYTVRNQCFCVYGGVAVRVVVVQGSVQTATIVASGQPVPPGNLESFRDVEGLFGVIDAAIDQRPARFEAEYDDTFGFPSVVAIDYRANVADEEFGWIIESFVVR